MWICTARGMLAGNKQRNTVVFLKKNHLLCIFYFSLFLFGPLQISWGSAPIIPCQLQT